MCFLNLLFFIVDGRLRCGVKVTDAFDFVWENEAKKNRPLWHCFVDKLVGEGIWLIIILLVILRRHIISYEIIFAVFCGQLLDRRLDVSGRGYLPE